MARTLTPRRNGPKSRPSAPARPSRTPAAPKLYPTKNDLPEATRIEVIALLNQRLAEAIDLQTQCKQAHWNVKGPAFIGLHKLFDEINEDVEEYVDLIAERVAQAGGIAEGTVGVSKSVPRLRANPFGYPIGPSMLRRLRVRPAR